jgi:hypothetical protein
MRCICCCYSAPSKPATAALPPAPAAGGHYIAYIKCGGCWYQCDDAYVNLVPEELVAASQAYMLFYIQKQFYHGS